MKRRFTTQTQRHGGGGSLSDGKLDADGTEAVSPAKTALLDDVRASVSVRRAPVRFAPCLCAFVVNLR